MTWLEDLDYAAKTVTCNLLQNDGINAALWAGVGGAIAVPEPASSIAGVTAGLGLIALQNGCAYDPNSGTAETPNQIGCGTIADGGFGWVYRIRPDGSRSLETGFTSVKTLTVGTPYFNGGTPNLPTINITWIETNGTVNTSGVFFPTGTQFELVPQGASTCETPANPVGNNPPAQVVVGPTTNCNYSVEFQSWYTGIEGKVSPVLKISSQPTPSLRADVGAIGGCNFDPIIYSPDGGGDGPPNYGPWNPDWDDGTGGVPPWLDYLNDLLAGLSGELIANQIANLLEAPFPPVEYSLNSVCELNAQGEPEQRVVEVDIPELKGYDAIIARINALPVLLQAQKDFKQPVCKPAPLVGDFRTISFKSDTVSPNGKSRLLKRLKYRSVSGIGLDALIDHWKDFVFEAGPVTVKHRGASWGTVTVWAESSDEGKRVIRHAGLEAGIDPDQVGYWEIGGSSSTRLGMPGTMRINTSGGYYWITERDGPTERPQVGQT